MATGIDTLILDQGVADALPHTRRVGGLGEGLGDPVEASSTTLLLTSELLNQTQQLGLR